MALRRWAAMLLVVATGCGAPGARTPDQVVDLYMAWLGHDPVRRLVLLTPGFHRAHGLTITDLEGLFWGGWGRVETRADSPLLRVAARLPASPASDVDRRRLAWLFVQRTQLFHALSPRVAIAERHTAIEGDRATVATLVKGPRGAPFRVRFELVRGGCERAWCIRQAVPTEVDAENAQAAFVVAPTLEGAQLIGRLRRDPSGAR